MSEQFTQGVAVGCALSVGAYILGRLRLGTRLLNWAEDAVAPGWKSWRFWPAAPIILAALAWVWAVHPRRTLANRRYWRDDQRAPAPQFDSNWAAKRHTTDTPPQS